MRIAFFAAVACLSLGCGGKLVNDFGATLTDGAPCDDIDAGGAESFVGTWTCHITTTSTTSNPGSTSYPTSFTTPIIFSGDDGGVSAALNAADSGSTCDAIRFAVSGDTATLDGRQVCFDEAYDANLTLTSGTFVVEGCGMTISNFTADIPARPGDPVDEAAVSTDTGTCTKN